MQNRKRKQKFEKENKREGNLPGGPQQPSRPAHVEAQQGTKSNSAQARYRFGGFKNRAKERGSLLLLPGVDNAQEPPGHNLIVDKLGPDAADELRASQNLLRVRLILFTPRFVPVALNPIAAASAPSPTSCRRSQAPLEL